MRALMAVLVAFVLLAAFARPAAASCAPPAPVSENASRAVAVVYGAVTSGDHSRVTVRVARVLKGSASSSLVAYLGPTRGGGASSVDYTASIGTDHVLYLMRGDDGQLETNACIGSHAGPPTAEEAALFGAGTTPSGTSAPANSRAPSTTIEATWVVAALAMGGLLLIAVMTARRRTR